MSSTHGPNTQEEPLQGNQTRADARTCKMLRARKLRVEMEVLVAAMRRQTTPDTEADHAGRRTSPAPRESAAEACSPGQPDPDVKPRSAPPKRAAPDVKPCSAGRGPPVLQPERRTLRGEPRRWLRSSFPPTVKR